MPARLSPQARADLQEIGLFIAADNPSRARSFVQELRDAAKSLGDNPERFMAVKHHPAGTVRRMPHRAYAVFYQIRKDQVLVLRVVHGAVISGRFMEDL
jgi:toxin ParE1/3/4